MGDRPRRPDEDVVDWAIDTHRIAASREGHYRHLLACGQITEPLVESLASAHFDGASTSSRGRAVQASAGKRVSAATSVGDPASEFLANDAAYRDGLALEPAPQLFPGGGALPLATASGLAPQAMAGVPWWLRPAIADAPTMAEAVELLQDASTPDGVAACSVDTRFTAARGLQDFKARVQGWAIRGGDAAAQRERDDRHDRSIAARAAAREVPLEERSNDELYDVLFGEADRHRASIAATQQRYNEARGARRQGR